MPSPVKLISSPIPALRYVDRFALTLHNEGTNYSDMRFWPSIAVSILLTAALSFPIDAFAQSPDIQGKAPAPARPDLWQAEKAFQEGKAAETQLAGVPQLQPQTGKRSLNLRGDTRSAYEQMALAFGLKVLFDADLPARNVRLQIEDVDFAAAVEILERETVTFIRPVDANTMFVAADTQEKRQQYGLTVERTFVIPDSVAPDEMSELLRIIRDISGSTHIELNTLSRSITLHDTPQIVELAGKLIQQIEQARGELLLDIDLLEVDRNKALQLGITPPSSARLITIDPNAVQSVLQARDLSALAALLQRIFGAAATSATGGVQVPPFILVGGGKTTALLTLPNAAATFSDALTLVRSGRRVLLRAQDGKPATFFVGDRFPITLSLLSSSLGSSPQIPVISGNIFPRSDFPVGNAPLALVAADFDNDGRLDLAVVNHNDNSISILLNQGQGNLAQPAGSPIKLPATETGPVAIASGVFNEASGQTDLVVVNQTSNNLTILHGGGTGAFTEAPNSPIAVGNSPTAVAVGHFNSSVTTNNHLDIAVTNSKDNTFTVLLGDGSGNFTPAPGSPFALAANEQNPIAIVTADFNADGIPDLAIVNQSTGVAGQTTGNVAILLGKGDGTFTAATGSPIAVGQTPVAIAAGDLNGDTRPDLAVVNQTDNTLTVLFNNGNATFSAAPNSPLATGTTPTGVAIADFNADGNADLVVTNSAVNSVGLYLGLGGGLFATRVDLPTTNNPSAILAADMTGGGLPDAVLTEEGSNEVSIIFNPSAFAGGTPGLAQQPYPASEYVDLGVKIKATPTLHSKNEVTLQLEFEIRALSGESVNGIPIISNRTLTQTVRVKADETTLLGGLFDSEETRTLTGLPGFSQLPAASYFFSQRNTQSTDTELLILVTPRRLRLPNRISKTIYAGRGVGSPTRGGALTGPLPGETPPQPPQPLPPLQPPPRGQPPPQPPQP